jgi:hypothetical protein
VAVKGYLLSYRVLVVIGNFSNLFSKFCLFIYFGESFCLRRKQKSDSTKETKKQNNPCVDVKYGRGRRLFESTAVAYVQCHAGKREETF